MNTYHFYKGDITSVSFDFDPSTKLSEVRQQLIDRGVLTITESQDQYRFVNYQNTDLKYEDMIIGISTEQYIPLEGVVGINNQSYLTDKEKTKAVDLIGFTTDWWFDRYMSCRMRLNTTDPEARVANNGKFQPFMLTNVKTANPNLPGISMENVVICEKDSIVEFNMSSWRSAGYGYQIKPVSGTPINSSPLYITFTDCPNGGDYANTTLRRYFAKNESQNNSTIKVVATDSLNLGGQTLNYMKFSIRTWKVNAYEKPAGTRYSCNLPLPVPSESTRDVTVTTTPYTKLVSAPETVVPGGTIEPGSTVPSGDQSTQTIGTIYNVADSQEPNSIVGEVVFYVFVFKTKAEAEAVFGRMNDIDPSVWENDA